MAVMDVAFDDVDAKEEEEEEEEDEPTNRTTLMETENNDTTLKDCSIAMPLLFPRLPFFPPPPPS